MTTIREKHLKVLDHLDFGLSLNVPHYRDDDFPNKTSPSHLRSLIDIARETKDMPDDKLARWTGFIQGVMAARGWLDVDEERDRTRPIFNDPTT